MDELDILAFMKSGYIKDPNVFFNVHEIMEEFGVDEEDILLVKNAMEDGVDAKKYERKIKKGKAWYRCKEVAE